MTNIKDHPFYQLIKKIIIGAYLIAIGENGIVYSRDNNAFVKEVIKYDLSLNKYSCVESNPAPLSPIEFNDLVQLMVKDILDSIKTDDKEIDYEVINLVCATLYDAYSNEYLMWEVLVKK